MTAPERAARRARSTRPVRFVNGRISFRAHPRTVLVCLVALVSCTVLLAVSLCAGAYPVAPAEVARALFAGTGERLAVHFVNQERLPQALLAVLAGGALGISGALVQSLSRNPLASPDVIGFNSGAATGAIVALVLSGGAAQVAVGAVGGGLCTALAVLLLARRHGGLGVRLVLVGLGVTALLGSVNSYLLTRADLVSAQNAHLWLVGTLNGRTWREVATLAVATAVLLPAVLLLARPLRMLEMGDEPAGGLGVRVDRTRLALIVLGVCLCAVAVATAGPIPFVALAAPQIASRLTRSPGVSVPAAGMTGAALLSAAHLLSVQFFAVLAEWGVVGESRAGSQLPVGVTTAVLGGGYLAWLLFSTRRGGRGGHA